MAVNEKAGSPSTIIDVARMAEVSTATVSRVIKSPEKVSPKTRERVQWAIDQVNYTPNVIAQSLRTRQTRTVILVVRDIANPFYLEIFQGVENQAHESGYSVLMGNTRDEPEREQHYFDMVNGRHADGLILMTGALPPKLRNPDARMPPTVVASEYIQEASLPTVMIDNVQAARKAVDHLLSLGHRRIAHISGPTPEVLSVDRETGYLNAMREAGINIEPGWIARGDFTVRSGNRAMHQLLAADPCPTAVFAANDEMAIGAINELVAHDLRVPRDMSIVGFDDIAFAGAYNPALTTIRQLRTEIGKQAMLMLADVMAGDFVSTEPVLIPTELVVRDSTSPLRA